MPTTRPPRSRWVVPWGPTSSASPRQPTDDELLLDVAAGNRQALATLSSHLSGLVHANIWRTLRDEHRTDTVADEVFVEVWRQAAGFDPGRDTALIWVLDLAHRLAYERDRHDAATVAGPGMVTPR